LPALLVHDADEQQFGWVSRCERDIRSARITWEGERPRAGVSSHKRQ
jgi:hypothetical protein